MTRLIVFQNPHSLWCFSCDQAGKILDAFPESMYRYVNSNIDEVSLIAASVLRYRVDRIDDNEYPSSFEITHNGEKIEVKQNGLKMGYIEEYGQWNKENNSLDKHSITDKANLRVSE